MLADFHHLLRFWFPLSHTLKFVIHYFQFVNFTQFFSLRRHCKAGIFSVSPLAYRLNARYSFLFSKKIWIKAGSYDSGSFILKTFGYFSKNNSILRNDSNDILACNKLKYNIPREKLVWKMHTFIEN